MGTLIAILQLIPSLIKAVAAAEEFVPIPGAGKAKLDFVLNAITSVYAGATALIPQITAVIAHIVTLANSTGVFGAKPTPPVA